MFAYRFVYREADGTMKENTTRAYEFAGQAREAVEQARKVVIRCGGRWISGTLLRNVEVAS